jgi:hypothetical protein
MYVSQQSLALAKGVGRWYAGVWDSSVHLRQKISECISRKEQFLVCVNFLSDLMFWHKGNYNFYNLSNSKHAYSVRP